MVLSVIHSDVPSDALDRTFFLLCSNKNFRYWDWESDKRFGTPRANIQVVRSSFRFLDPFLNNAEFTITITSSNKHAPILTDLSTFTGV